MPTSAPSKQGEKMHANFYDFIYYRRINSAAAMIFKCFFFFFFLTESGVRQSRKSVLGLSLIPGHLI